MISFFIILTIVILFCVIYDKFFRSNYEKCYDEMEKEGHAVFGNCCGLSGGDKNTSYLNDDCIDCPYLCMETVTSDHIDILKRAILTECEIDGDTVWFNGKKYYVNVVKGIVKEVKE